MTAVAPVLSKLSFFTAAGVPLSGGLVSTYLSGTNTPATTWQDSGQVTPNTNPIVLDSRGQCTVWVAGSQSYKFVVNDSSNVLQYTMDPVRGSAAPGANTDITSLSGLTSVNGGQLAGLRNRIINGNFGVNQRAVTGTVTLSAGAYGHDRWKAGAAGCTYTFASSLNGSVLTITAGSLMQVIEGSNIEGGIYSLSQQGTAQARIGVNGAPGGGYATASSTSPLASGSAGANQTVTVEFSTGTVDRVQLELGSTATTFEQRPAGLELALCQRYAVTISNIAVYGYCNATSQSIISTISFPVTMRVAPTMTLTSSGTLTSGWSTAFNGSATVSGFQFQVVSNAAGAGGILNGIAFASAEL